jgi:transcriptional regulator with XRE-family HTH domain
VEYWAEWRSAAIGELPMNSDQARHIRPARAPAERVPAERALVAALSGPTALRIALGAQLRRLREDSHVTVVDAAEAIRATHSKISRLERGRSSAKQREELLALARQANTPGWWQPYNDVLPSWFELYLGLEKAASIIRLYEVQFVHGLLQTEDYARAVILIANAHAPAEEIERRVSVRMKRQQLLTQPDAPQVWAVLDEAALRRWPAGPAEMRAQLEHLLEVTELPNVTLQVVPFDIGPHAAAGGPFTILRFPEPDLPDMVYLEQLNSAVYLDHPDDVIDYVTVMDQLCVRARTGPDSKDMISALLKQI